MPLHADNLTSFPTAKLHVHSSLSKCPKVHEFLSSKGRNSVKTADTYASALYRFDVFLKSSYPRFDIESILTPLKRKKVDVYKLLDQFIAHLSARGHPAGVISVWLAGVKGYLGYHDVDIIDSKFKRRVTVPKIRQEDAYAVDKEMARQILLGMSSLRLKTFCVIEACAGPRPLELSALRDKDVDFASTPTTLYLRAEYSKNKLPREIYITEEASALLRRWIKHRAAAKMASPLVFAVGRDPTPEGIYDRISEAFRHHLRTIGMNKRKPGLARRHEITLYSFRRLVETTIEDNTSANFADYILGHKKSPYYNHREDERRRIYGTKCAPQLTYFDYQDLEMKIMQKDAEIARFEDVTMIEMANMMKKIASMQARIDSMDKKPQPDAGPV